MGAGARAPRVAHAAWLLLLPLFSLVLVFSSASFGRSGAGDFAPGSDMLVLSEGGDPAAAHRAAQLRAARRAARSQRERSKRDQLPLAEVIAREEAQRRLGEDDVANDADVIDVGDEKEGQDQLEDQSGGVGTGRESVPSGSDAPPYVLPYDEDPRVVVVARKPKSFLFKNLLTDQEADALIDMARPTMLKSTVVDSSTGKSVDSNIRTSSGTFLSRGQNDLVSVIEEKVANYSKVPVTHGEGLQILHYEIGQKYEAHYDYFHDKFNTSPEKGGQRLATVLMYLTTVEKGGETVFPHSSPKPDYAAPPLSDEFWSACAKRGAANKPQKGDALLFFSLTDNMKEDSSSLHASCPVIAGEKWSATKWMHIGEFGTGTTRTNKHEDGKNCRDDNANCAMWAKAGECDKNPAFMTGPEGQCQMSCGACHTDVPHIG